MNEENLSQYHLRELEQIAKSGSKPLIIWLGAGVSRMCGYPLWNELAQLMHTEFLRYEPKYSPLKKEAIKLLDNNDYPKFFSLCFTVNSKRYYLYLHTHLSLKSTTPLYDRLVRALENIDAVKILTTNVDEMLEKSLNVETIQPYNLELNAKIASEGHGYLCKLHGSISDLSGLVFRTEEYEALINNKGFIEHLKKILMNSSIVFIGYSLRDQYLLDILNNAEDISKLIGDGPHFIVAPHQIPELPNSVKSINYDTEVFSDHRSALKVIELIGHSEKQKGKLLDEIPLYPVSKESRYLLSGLMTYGTWNTSQIITFTNDFVEGKKDHFSAIIGTGFINSELPPGLVERSLHDLIVGLICFDKLYLPLNLLGTLHTLLGGVIFWELVKNDIFRLVHIPSDLAIVFGAPIAVKNGDLALLNSQGGDPKAYPVDGKITPIKPSEIIRKHIRAVEGKEEEVEDLFKLLESHTLELLEEDMNKVPVLARSTLIMPNISKLLGLSEALSPTNIPKWAAFPVLRLAKITELAIICQKFEISAAKMPFGTSELASAAFSLSTAQESADQMASYVMSGKFDSDLGLPVSQNLNIIDSILNFRNSSEGEIFRRNILDSLNENKANEFVAALSAGLKKTVPSTVLESARNKLAGFMMANSTSLSTKAIWTDVSNENTLKSWKAHSKKILDDYCTTNKIRPYDYCPCGSGDKLKFCCQDALK